MHFLKDSYQVENGFNGAGFAKLTLFIQKAALPSGFEAFKNGKYHAKRLGLL